MGRKAFNFQWLVFIPALLLSTVGLVVLLSFNADYFYQQLIIGLIGIGIFFILSKVDFSLYFYLNSIFYALTIVLLLVTFLGPSVRGATRWINLGGIRIQPSELVKPFFMICFASFFVRFPLTKIRNLYLLILLFSIPFILIYKQPDLGNSLIYTGIFLGLLLVSDISPWWLLIGGILCIVFAPAGFYSLKDYQRLRILTFLDPVRDPQGSGYNALQSLITVGSGQIWGRGFGRGTQSILKFLPEHHTDFIFAAFVEEFGFSGGIILLVIFFMFLWRILKLASKRLPQTVSFYYLIGYFIQIFLQMAIHIGMNLGLIPVTGITLPFVSYGGSSLLSLWIGLGISMSALRVNTQKSDLL